jgi:sugar/nucleoside kinase (ribokinase family)
VTTGPNASPFGSSLVPKDRPNYLLVGHVTRDVVSDGFLLGGTVTYAGLAAVALGRRVAAVTSVGADLRLADILPGISIRNQPAEVTTTFENVYHDGHRQQWLRSVAASLDINLIPDDWRSARIVHLAPLAGEFGPDLVFALRDSRVLGLTAQGWMRSWDAEGRVRRAPWREADEVLPYCDAVVFSEEDVEGDWDLCHRYAQQARLLVVTQGVRGCTVFESGRAWQVPGFPVTEVDATGAGDVFAAALFVGLGDGKTPVEAAQFANCVASFAVEVRGAGGIPSLASIERRFASRSPAVTAIVLPA